MSQKKILIIDDDPDMRLGLGVRLRAGKYATVFAADGATAIAAAQRERPDVILLDLGLPGGDGFLVLERMAAIPRLASIPVIVVTARDPAASEAKALGLGARRFLQKPVDAETLLAAIEAATEGS
jgi:DNA-binding response OmpR family regulator